MSENNRKTGRENKKPKQAGGKSTNKSPYQLRQNEAGQQTPFKIKKG